MRFMADQMKVQDEAKQSMTEIQDCMAAMRLQVRQRDSESQLSGEGRAGVVVDEQTPVR
jgi:hypothetical protein